MGDLRYVDAGVDIDEGSRAVALIKQAVARTHTPSVLGGIGAFSGLFRFDPAKYNDPILVSSTDGVGSKIKIAIAVNRHRGIGLDIVNHCVNDILCCGAEPLFFLDYFATGKLAAEQLADIVEGMAEACSAVGCAIVGGETAEVPGLYGLGDYDLAGFVVGVVDRDKIIDGSRIAVGDVVLALPSSGLHTNGYSLVRHLVSMHELDYATQLPGTDAPLADLLLEPHRCYLPAIRELRKHVDIRGLAHITGGGLTENVPRILPDGIAVAIDRSSWTIPPLFIALENLGIHPDEMWRTFNMGIGMVIVVPASDADKVMSTAALPVWKIGTIVEQTDAHRVILR